MAKGGHDRNWRWLITPCVVFLCCHLWRGRQRGSFPSNRKWHMPVLLGKIPQPEIYARGGWWIIETSSLKPFFGGFVWWPMIPQSTHPVRAECRATCVLTNAHCPVAAPTGSLPLVLHARSWETQQLRPVMMSCSFSSVRLPTSSSCSVRKLRSRWARRRKT